MRQSLINPQPVRGTHIPPQRNAARAVHQLHDPFAIDSGGNRLTESQIREPLLLVCDLNEARLEIVEVKHQKVVFQAGAEIEELITMISPLFREQIVIFGTYAADQVRVPGLKTDDLRILIPHK